MDDVRGKTQVATIIDDSQELEYPVVKVEEPEYCKLKVHYEGDPEVVNEIMDEAVATLRKVSIPGYRKGKAPDDAIKVRLRPQINQYVAREMAQRAIDDIVFETDAKLVGQPKFTNVSIKGNKFSCDIESNRKPDFEIGELEFEIPKPALETDEEALAEKSLLNLRKRVGEQVAYEEDDFVELGDEITFSFEATVEVDGKQEPLEGYTVEGEMYAVGSDRWGGWDENILGMKADETKEFDFTFETGPEEIVGKTAHFSVTVHMGTKRKPHPINEDFYKTMGVENVEELLNKLRAIAKASIEKSKSEQIRGQVAIKLVETHEFDVPSFMVDAEAKHLAAQTGIDFDVLDDEAKKEWLENGEKSVRLTLILDTIRDGEPDSVLNDSEAKVHLAKHMAAQGQDPNGIFNNPAAGPQIATLVSAIKDEFTLQWVASKATLIE